MSLALQVDVIDTPDGLARLAAEWQALWLAQPRREIFGSHAWCMAAWQCQSDAASPHVLTVRRGASLVGLLPLLRDRAGVRFLAGPWSDYNDILVDPAEARTGAVVTAALAALAAGAVGARLAEVPDWSHLAAAWPQLPPALRHRLVVERGADCPALRLTQDRAALLKEMSGKQSLKRHEKKLQKFGPVRLRHLHDRDAIRAALADFYDQHVARRALVGDRSLFLEERSRRFYEALVERLDPAQELRFAILEAGDKVVAYHFGFEVGGRFTWYKPSFDVDYIATGPGEVLIKRLLEYIQDRPVHEFDFTRGNESFKDRFANHRGHNLQWTLHPGTGQAWIARRRAAAVAWAKSTPWVVGLRQRWRGAGASSAVVVPGVALEPASSSDTQAATGAPADGAGRRSAVLSLRTLAGMAARDEGPIDAASRRGLVQQVAGGARCNMVYQGEAPRGAVLLGAGEGEPPRWVPVAGDSPDAADRRAAAELAAQAG